MREERQQGVMVDGLDEVVIKARLFGPAPILVLSVA